MNSVPNGHGQNVKKVELNISCKDQYRKNTVNTNISIKNRKKTQNISVKKNYSKRIKVEKEKCIVLSTQRTETHREKTTQTEKYRTQIVILVKRFFFHGIFKMVSANGHHNDQLFTQTRVKKVCVHHNIGTSFCQTLLLFPMSCGHFSEQIRQLHAKSKKRNNGNK